MSGASLFRNALRRVVALRLPVAAERDLVAALEASRAGSLQLFYDAGREAGLDASALEPRGTALAFCYCAGQLADDLADGDCDYLEEPHRTGPAAQFMLQNLFFACLQEAHLPPDTGRAVALELVQGAGPQQDEVRARRFHLSLARDVAEGISGRQFGAYLAVLWCGTELEPLAIATGRDLGFAAHVCADVRSGDPRYRDLDGAERRALVSLAREAAARVRSRGLRCMEAPLRDIDAVLGAAP